MNTFGLHTFAIAPVWDLARIEPQMDRLKELGIGLLEIPLLRPEEIDTKRTRAFAEPLRCRAYSVARPAALARRRGAAGRGAGLPRTGLRRLRRGGQLRRWAASPMARSARRPDARRRAEEIDGMCRFLVRAAKAAKAHGLKLGIEPCNRYETHLINRGIDADADHRARRRRQHLHPSRHLPHAYRGGEFRRPASRRPRPISAMSMCRKPIAACPGAACSTGRPA